MSGRMRQTRRIRGFGLQHLQDQGAVTHCVLMQQFAQLAVASFLGKALEGQRMHVEKKPFGGRLASPVGELRGVRLEMDQTAQAIAVGQLLFVAASLEHGDRRNRQAVRAGRAQQRLMTDQATVRQAVNGLEMAGQRKAGKTHHSRTRRRRVACTRGERKLERIAQQR